ncbi:MAG: hypothetical protein AAF465_01490 [Pseudomonadota bacterium]
MFKHLTMVLGVMALSACTITTDLTTQDDGFDSWIMVLENDADGNTLEGSKDVLIRAVRNGKPVRVYTAGRRIEHAADAQFLSIFDGEVFAQLTPIESQRPTLEPLQMVFREPGQKWRAIRGTNGFVTAFMDGGEPNIRQAGTVWFVQY